MKSILAVIISSCCAVMAYADEPCGNAVDDADSMNVNKPDCDYSKEGLNGYLHKAFNKNEEGGAVLAAAPAAVSMAAAGGSSTTVAVNGNTEVSAVHKLSVDVEQWSLVNEARSQLLPKALELCTSGFSVVRENYRPKGMGKIALTIEFSCLQ